MDRDHDYRLLTIGSLVVAFGLGVVFAVLGLGLRPRTVLAPDLPPDLPSGSRPTPHPMTANIPRKQADSVPGDGTHDVPEGYPVKGNHRSMIYHLPGGLAYDRTIATEYYRTAEAAEAAGYRASKA